jgi:hypothetical protein
MLAGMKGVAVFKLMIRRNLLVLAAVLAAPLASHAESLNCALGTSDQFGSGWCDLNPPVTFPAGVCLQLGVGGSANNVVVRILGRGQDPTQAVGLVTNSVTVPQNRQLIVKLQRQYPNSTQVSIHGGKAAWHIRFPESNGPATLNTVEHVTCPPGTK